MWIYFLWYRGCGTRTMRDVDQDVGRLLQWAWVLRKYLILSSHESLLNYRGSLSFVQMNNIFIVFCKNLF